MRGFLDPLLRPFCHLLQTTGITGLSQGYFNLNFSFFLFFTLKRYWPRDNKNTLKKIPLVARPCIEVSRRNRGRGWIVTYICKLFSPS